MTNPRPWWQHAVIYQIVVPSFLDTDGDGMGDLQGIIQRLDYLQWLGVQALWLTPMYPSPLADLGYDIADFRGVEPRFGADKDFDELLHQAHGRDLRIILDWVPNHTSDEHPWFVQSRSSRDNPKRNWYIWRDAKPDGSPPNNWISIFGGSVWQWDEKTEQFYLHTFLDKQPDLNWRNQEVQTQMLDDLRFWLDRGVDGFRIDALDLLMEDEQLRDNPPNPDYHDGQGPDSQLLSQHTRDQPETHDVIALVRSVVDEYDDRLLAGELYLPVDALVSYYGDHRPQLHLPLNLQLAWLDWDVEAIAGAVQQYLAQIPPGGWPTWTISTHDCPRLAARCPGEQTRVAAMLLLTLPGTPTHYYGEELGMRGTPIPSEQATDPQGRRTGRNRDPERTPMQWSGELHAGFSQVEPWLPISDDFSTANVASQTDDPHSLLTLYRRLFALRQTQSPLIAGRCEKITQQDRLLTYRRAGEDGQLLILLNFGNQPQAFDLSDYGIGRVLLSTFLDREDEEVQERIELRGDEGIIVSL